MPNPGEVTRLLQQWRRGDQAAFDELLPLVYNELRRIARSALRRERPGHALQATALVHEAFLRLVEQERARIRNRGHFLSVAAQAMRRILVDHERRRRAAKRGGGEEALSLLEAAAVVDGGPPPDVLAVHRSLEELAEIDERQARLVELRYFGGLTMVEAAEALGVSRATAERDWTAARLWLRRRLSAPAEGGPPGAGPEVRP
jgi:RNA polymerase sigma factor (TIGR02999 family)